MSSEFIKQFDHHLEKLSHLDQRKVFLDDFNSKEFPSKKIEDWRYLNLKNLLAKLDLEKAHSLDNHPKLLPEDYDGDFIIFKNGLIDQEQSIFDKDKIKLKTLIQPNTRNDENRFFNPFNLFNQALAPHYYQIEITQNLEKPLLFFHLSSGLNIPSVEIHLKTNISAKIIEVFHAQAENQNNFTNPKSNFHLEQNSQLDYFKLISENHHSTHLSSLEINQEKSSQFDGFFLLLNGDIVREEIIANLNDQQAHFKASGLYLPQLTATHDIHCYVNHFKPNTFSDLLFKGIANDQAKAVFNGRVVVHEGADGVIAHQKNQNLLLSDEAEINPKPDLEIYADDVQCSHGATIGRHDENVLFYLKSRGIPHDQAMTMLNHSFIEELVEKINHNWAKKYFLNYLHQNKIL
jgi:Fe-S cluster assembly protein SufD